MSIFSWGKKSKQKSEEPTRQQETQNVVSTQENVVEKSGDSPVPVFKEETQLHPQEKKGLFSRLLSGLKKTKTNIGYGFKALFKGKKIDDDLFEELETNLLISDMGMDTTRRVIKDITDKARLAQLHDADALYELLRNSLYEIIAPVEKNLEITGDHSPRIPLRLPHT